MQRLRSCWDRVRPSRGLREERAGTVHELMAKKDMGHRWFMAGMSVPGPWLGLRARETMGRHDWFAAASRFFEHNVVGFRMVGVCVAFCPSHLRPPQKS